MRLRFLLLALVVAHAAACTRSASCTPTTFGSDPRSQAMAPARVLLATDDARSATTSYATVDVRSGAPRVDRTFVAPAKRLTGYASPTYLSMAAHDGRGATVTLASGGTGGGLVYRSAAGRVATIALDAAPDSLALDADELLIGVGTTVRYVHLDGDAPEASTVVTLDAQATKAFDLFARHGDFVVAIDDILVPIFGASFRRVGGVTQHVATFELPPFVNGQYVLARFVGSAEGTGTLYAIGRYSVLDGHGQTVAAIPFADARPTTTLDIMNALVNPSGRLVEEHVSRETGQPVSLLAGAAYSTITGLDVLADASSTRLLLAAGERGLLVFQTVPRGPATATPVAGIAGCSDVLVDGDRILVLVDSALVVLDRSFVEMARMPLARPYVRFVR